MTQDNGDYNIFKRGDWMRPQKKGEALKLTENQDEALGLKDGLSSTRKKGVEPRKVVGIRFKSRKIMGIVVELSEVLGINSQATKAMRTNE